jgi:Domain of unknown function (DUF4169)
MADIVNLNRARKAKARAAKDDLAAQNRVKFGRTKAEKQAESAIKSLTERKLDSHKRED